ncbi:hypothetical protein H6758_00955 [Candidatus Nomurabacteria bacterium]|nr:hypothetical protein [Candidatus Nomurabacteria bacterium]
MKFLYTLIGPIFFLIEVLLYEGGKQLSDFWYAHKAGFGKLGDLCKNADAVGNCLDFRWHSFVAGIGLFGIKILVLITFLLVLFKKKKFGPALSIVLLYSGLILSFHFNIIPIERFDELYWWLELANIGGVLAVGILILVSLVASTIYYFRRKKNETSADCVH